MTGFVIHSGSIIMVNITHFRQLIIDENTFAIYGRLQTLKWTGLPLRLIWIQKYLILRLDRAFVTHQETKIAMPLDHPGRNNNG